MKKINFRKSSGLVPVIIQEDTTGEVLMLGYMSQEAWQKTLKEGFVYFWSRRRKKLWLKGEKSGNKFVVKKILLDCDEDTILIQVKLISQGACHKGNKSCFNNLLIQM